MLADFQNSFTVVAYSPRNLQQKCVTALPCKS